MTFGKVGKKGSRLELVEYFDSTYYLGYEFFMMMRNKFEHCLTIMRSGQQSLIYLVIDFDHSHFDLYL